MQLICSSMSIGGTYRFPVLMYQKGGIAFLIPYTFFTVVIGIPISYMEMSLGQYSERGLSNVWVLCPLMQGLGFAMCVLNATNLLCNNALLSYTMIYFLSSFERNMPWSSCDHEWAQENCLVRTQNATMLSNCFHKLGKTRCLQMKWEVASEHFFMKRILNITGAGFVTDGIGQIRWELCLCMLVICSIIFICTAKGLKTLEKISTFGAIYPFAAITLLVFVTLVKEGALRGLTGVLKPKFEMLLDGKVWYSAMHLAILSVGAGFGMIMTFSSFCQFRSPLNMDAIILSLYNYGFCVLTTVFVYNCVGVITINAKTPVYSLISTGRKTPFVIVAEALPLLPGPVFLWSLVFYSAILSYGLCLQISTMITLLSAFYDKFPRMRNHTVLGSAAGCVILYFSSLLMCTSNGFILLSIMDSFSAGPLLGTILFLEVLTVAWLYGVGRFIDDVHFMLGFRPSNYWQACWIFLPIPIGVCLFLQISSFKKAMAGLPQTVTLSMYCFLYILPFLPLVITGLFTIISYKKSKMLNHILEPKPEWGPPDPILVKSRRMFSSQSMTKEYMYRQTRLRAIACAPHNKS